MAGFRPPVKPEVKATILEKIKAGERVPELARQYELAPNTIYGWLTKKANAEPGTLEMSRLKRENAELYALVGRVTAELERAKKNRPR